MLLYLSLGSRLAPLLLMLSAILAGMRWLHDQPALAARHLNGVAAALYVVAGLVVAVPFAVRMGLIVGTRTAIDHRDFELAGARIEQYAFWGGRMEGNLLFARGMARAREGRVAEAVPDFLAAARSDDPLVSRSMAVLHAALGEFALHRDADAARLFAPLPDSAIRDYCLGRIAERHNDLRAEAGHADSAKCSQRWGTLWTPCQRGLAGGRAGSHLLHFCTSDTSSAHRPASVIQTTCSPTHACESA